MVIHEKEDKVSDEISNYVRLSEFAEKQINRAWKAYTIIGIIIAVGIVLLQWQYGDNLKGIEKSIQERTEIVQVQVNKKIETEFDTNNIKNMIKLAATNAAKEQIDIQKVKEIINLEIIDIVEKELVLFRKELDEARDDLTITFDLLEMTEKAKNDISCFMRLQELMFYRNEKIGSLARNNIDRIRESIELQHIRLTDSYFGAQWTYSFNYEYFGIRDSKHWTLKNYIAYFKSVPNDQKGPYIISVLSLEKLPQSEKYAFLKHIYDNSKMPICLYISNEYINRFAKIDKDFLYDSTAYLSWLKRNM